MHYKKTSVGVPAGIRTEHLPNTSLELYCSAICWTHRDWDGLGIETTVETGRELELNIHIRIIVSEMGLKEM
jgi:hypothetical protein